MLYFAYGSNLFEPRFEYRIGPYKKICNYRLKGFRLVFDTGHVTHSFANIVPCRNAIVEGVIYEIDEEQEKQLDFFEGVRIGMYSKAYFDYFGEPVLYYEGLNKTTANPDSFYLMYIIEGCEMHGLTTTEQKLRKYGKQLYPYLKKFDK